MRREGASNLVKRLVREPFGTTRVTRTERPRVWGGRRSPHEAATLPGRRAASSRGGGGPPPRHAARLLAKLRSPRPGLRLARHGPGQELTDREVRPRAGRARSQPVSHGLHPRGEPLRALVGRRGGPCAVGWTQPHQPRRSPATATRRGGGLVGAHPVLTEGLAEHPGLRPSFLIQFSLGGAVGGLGNGRGGGNGRRNSLAGRRDDRDRGERARGFRGLRERRSGRGRRPNGRSGRTRRLKMRRPLRPGRRQIQVLPWPTLTGSASL